jgi:hypothetical protein
MKNNIFSLRPFMLLLKSSPNIDEIIAVQKKIKIANVKGDEKSVDFFFTIFMSHTKNKNIQTVFVAAIDTGKIKARIKSP